MRCHWPLQDKKKQRELAHTPQVRGQWRRARLPRTERFHITHERTT